MGKEKKEIFNFPDTPFDMLMRKRIHKVLLLCSSYDAFALEEDGRIEEQLFNEYISHNLSHPPRIIQTSNSTEAIKILNNTYIDLVITMLNVGTNQDAFEFAKEIKSKFPHKPIVVLTPFSREVTLRIEKEDLSAIDYVFSWLGHADILLAIIKLIEDNMNAAQDIEIAGVQAILLVEDSIRYYSGYLTNMYKIVLTQARKFMSEGLNKHRQMLQMRGRPKILLATNYNQAMELYDKYKDHLLGIISDTKYKRNGIMDPEAGIKFLRKVKQETKFIPTLLQSSDASNYIKAKELNAGFLYKYSENLTKELRDFMNEYFAFGSFRFRNPVTKELVCEAENLKELHSIIYTIPDDSLLYHVQRNHLSKWLNARALFPVANFLRNVKIEDFKNLHELRVFIDKAFLTYRKNKSRGIISKFDKNKYDSLTKFARIGEGYIGGKARGLAFLDSLIKKYPELDNFEGVQVRIPQTVVLSTEIFDMFIDDNDLYEIAYSNQSNEEILEKFLSVDLPDFVVENIRVFLSIAKNPIAVRSSSVLEDSYYQPFAGVYSTYMVSNSAEEPEINLEQVLRAIKGVFASVFYKETKAYMNATSNVIDEEKMGVVLQEVCGTKYGTRFYPTFSGVARSVNFYPIELEKPEDGVVSVALGLGKHIVEGKKSLRFSPKYPTKILQLSSPEMALNETQKNFYALDLEYDSFKSSTDDGVNIKTFTVRDAEADGSIADISSVFDFHDNILKEGNMYKGKRLITFANVLKYNTFPIAEIIQTVLRICEIEMNNPVEIEFAVNLNTPNKEDREFSLLQIRPIVKENFNFGGIPDDLDKNDTIIISDSALGNGIVENVCDIVYVKPQKFDSTNNQLIVPIIEKLNEKFVQQNRNYILLGPGRWGSSDPWLGIPVKWAHISQARVIVEAGLTDYMVEPSQGTHFFQNLTSFRVGYFTINPYKKDGFFDLDFIESQDVVYEDEFVRHVRFNQELLIKVDGKKSMGVVYKPGKGYGDSSTAE